MWQADMATCTTSHTGTYLVVQFLYLPGATMFNVSPPPPPPASPPPPPGAPAALPPVPTTAPGLTFSTAANVPQARVLLAQCIVQALADPIDCDVARGPETMPHIMNEGTVQQPDPALGHAILDAGRPSRPLVLQKAHWTVAALTGL